MTIKLACLFSGGGRTILNILDHIERGDLDAKITLVIASQAGIAGIDRLQQRGLDVRVTAASEHVRAALKRARPDLICLCGYLRKLHLEPWMQGRVLNIHPALLPKYGGKGMYGLHVHRKVLENHEKISGCTVHIVDEEYDHGPRVLQLTCNVTPEDTPQMLADRCFALECKAYPQAITLVAAQQKV